MQLQHQILLNSTLALAGNSNNSNNQSILVDKGNMKSSGGLNSSNLGGIGTSSSNNSSNSLTGLGNISSSATINSGAPNSGNNSGNSNFNAVVGVPVPANLEVRMSNVNTL